MTENKIWFMASTVSKKKEGDMQLSKNCCFMFPLANESTNT